MKSDLLWVVLLVLSGWQAEGQIIRTVGGNGADYSTLKSAFDDINVGIVQGEVSLNITGNTVENEAAVLNASGTGGAEYTSVTIVPRFPGLSITGNLNGALVHISGADHVTIDGRVGGSGERDLVIANSNTGTSSSTLYISGGATNNTIHYCIIKGATKCTSGAVVHIGSAGETSNSGILIDHCLITKDAAGMPVNLIYSYGSTMKSNSATISWNELCDFYSATGNSHAICIGSYSDYWDVHHNSIYQTSPVTASNVTLYGFKNTGGIGIRVFSNYIGGSGPELSGAPWSTTGSGTIRFVGICIYSNPGVAGEIFDNKIGLFSWTSSSCSGALPGIWTGILVRGGSANVGTLGANIIGAGSGTGNVTIFSTCGGNMASSFGIATHTTGVGEVNINNNIVGAVTVGNTSSLSGSGHRFTGIQVNYGGSHVSGNHIGSTDTPRSIQVLSEQVSSSSSNSQDLTGIQYSSPGTGPVFIDGNLISNLYNGWKVTGSGKGITRGIMVTSGTGNLLVRGNTIMELSSPSNNTDCGFTEAMTGIVVSSSPAFLDVSGNTINGLSLTTSSGNRVCMAGILITGAPPAGTISRNRLTGFKNSSTLAEGGWITGIHLTSGTYGIDNNIICITNAENTNPATIRGICDEASSSSEHQYWFNTVRIGGMQSAGVQSDSYCFLRTASSAITLRNNLFSNERMCGQGTGTHYGMAIQVTAGDITVDYNNYWTGGATGSLGLFGTGVVNQLPVVPDQDIHSLSADPDFPSDDDLRPASPALDGSGLTIPEVTFDYDSIVRADPPDIGAYEFTTAPAASSFSGTFSDAWEEPGNWDHGLPGNVTAATVPAGKLTVVHEQAVCHHLTINPGGALTVGHGAHLLVSGHLDLVSDGTCHGSLIAGAGSLTVTGNATVRHCFSGGAESWHLLSSPVSGQLVAGDFTPAGCYPDGTGYDFYLWQEGTMTWMNRKAPTWLTANGGNEFVPGRGYLVAYQELNPIKNFVGTLNAGTFDLPLSALGAGIHRHLNLLGNPYPSCIDWKASTGLNKSGLYVTPGGGHDYYIFNPVAGNYGVYNDASLSDEGTNGCTRFISPMQGFFVTSGPEGGSFTMGDSARLHANSPWLKDVSVSVLTIRVLTPDGRYDEVRLEFGYPHKRCAARKVHSFIDTAPSLFLEDSGDNWSVLFLSGTENESPMHLIFQSGLPGDYTLQGFESGTLPGKLMAEDCSTGERFYPVETNYRFSYPAPGDFRRFILCYTKAGIDPKTTTSGSTFCLVSRPGEIVVMHPAAKKIGNKGEIKVFNATGKLLLKKALDTANQETILETGSLPTGIGLVWIMNGEGVGVMQKVVFIGLDP